MTACIAPLGLSFYQSQPVEVTLDAPQITANAGASLLRQVNDQLGLSAWLAAAIPAPRHPTPGLPMSGARRCARGSTSLPGATRTATRPTRCAPLGCLKPDATALPPILRGCRRRRRSRAVRTPPPAGPSNVCSSSSHRAGSRRCRPLPRWWCATATPPTIRPPGPSSSAAATATMTTTSITRG
jgi:hypothetical protein